MGFRFVAEKVSQIILLEFLRCGVRFYMNEEWWGINKFWLDTNQLLQKKKEKR